MLLTWQYNITTYTFAPYIFGATIGCFHNSRATACHYSKAELCNFT